MIKVLQPGSVLVFDSVSRMSCHAGGDGYEDYKMLCENGVTLAFLKESLINTSVLEESSKHIIDIKLNIGNNALMIISKAKLHSSIIYHQN